MSRSRDGTLTISYAVVLISLPNYEIQIFVDTL